MNTKSLLSYFLLFICIFLFSIVSFPQSKVKEKIELNSKQIETINTLQQKADQLFQIRDLKESSRYLNQIAVIYWEVYQYDKAISYFLKSIDLNKDLDNDSGINGLYSNLALVYADVADYENALIYFQKCLEYRKKSKEKVGIIATLINVAVVNNNLKKYQESISNLEEALALSKEINDLEQIRLCYGMLSETYEKAGNTEKSLYYFNYYRSIHELINASKINKMTAKVEEQQFKNMALEIEKKNKELELLKKEKEVQLTENELEAEKLKSIKLYDTLSKKDIVLKLIQNETKNKALEIEKQKTVSEKEKLVRRGSIIAIIVALILFSLLFINRFQSTLGNKRILRQEKQLEILREVIYNMNLEIENLKNKKTKIFNKKDEKT